MTSMATRQLSPPPDEVFRLLPAYLESVDDWLSLLLLSKHHHGLVSAATTGPVLLRLCYLSRQVFLRPSPLLLLAWLTPSIAAWAGRSDANRDRLKSVIPLGADELLAMAVYTPAIAREAAWSPGKVRSLQDWRQSTFEPLSELVDRCIGEKWYGQEGFWDGAAEDARSLAGEPCDAPLQLAIYGEMFGGAWDAWLEANAAREVSETIDESSARRAARGLDSRDPLLPPLGRPSVRADLLKYIALDRELHWRNCEWLPHLRVVEDPPDLVDDAINDYPVSEVDIADPILPRSHREETDPSTGQDAPIGAYTGPVTDGANEQEQAMAVDRRTRRIMNVAHPWKLSPLYLIRNEDDTPYGRLIPLSLENQFGRNIVDTQGCMALEHLLTRSPLWGRLMVEIRSVARGDLGGRPLYLARGLGDTTVGWRQQLWEQCFYLLGLDGLSIVAQVYLADRAAEQDRLFTGLAIERESFQKEGYLDLSTICTEGPTWDKLRRWRSRIAALKVQPRTIDLIQSRIYEVPHLYADLEMLSFGGPR